MSDFHLSNKVRVSIGGYPYSVGGYVPPIVFDIRKTEENRNLGTGDGSLYQNITIEDAKRIRRALKRAIKNAEGK